MTLKIRDGFTLIELLVVVAIIGILAAVAVVNFVGFTEAAKVAATKTNHTNAVKYITSELMKCEIGSEIEPVILNKSHPFSCANVNKGTHKKEHLFANLVSFIDNYRNNKNPFDSTTNYFRVNNSIPVTKGFTYCNWDDPGDGGKGYCRTRYGDGSNDYLENIWPKN